MALIFGFNSIHDLLAKLQRDASILENNEVTGDAFFNFVITGYSMIDWVKNDSSVPATAKTRALIHELYNDQWLRVCGDLATAAKHFTLTQRRPIAAHTEIEQGWGVGRWGAGRYGIGEKNIEIKLNDGTTFNGLELVEGVITTRTEFFKNHIK